MSKRSEHFVIAAKVFFDGFDFVGGFYDEKIFCHDVVLLAKWIDKDSGCFCAVIGFLLRQPENGFLVFRLPFVCSGCLNVLFLLFLK